ncbi:phytanoyl-CoA dioxygenase family protein [Hansschlegelia zhihuaiae]|uniref:Phytanoyl-CoA dioxygenase n=1 Tax=Hansschlegelia zhihuaiae TaxID=405005 RepID=A0A4Q0M3E6_9HYPH|nr:phytanoyl-CoA dioxygenase family protein [Hansschlegelia zhihuaiae]RXF67427.1 hypothetical protein EK403_21375 [Hansschlegelia zhihuaiae]
MLTATDIAFFALNGYVVKRGVLERDLLDKAAEVAWLHLPSGFHRDDPQSWTEKVADCRGDMTAGERFGLVKLRREIRSDGAVARITIRNRVIMAMAAQLLGEGNVAPPQHFRGLYPIFPTPEHADVPVNAHIDVTPTQFRLSIGVYVDDVPKGGGGLAVWPRSHRSLFFAARATGCTFEDMATDDFYRNFCAWNGTEPTEIPGKAGDVIFFHNRLLHAPSLNILPGHVRLAAYFNLGSPDDEPTEPLAMWDGWFGVQEQAVASAEIRATEVAPVAPPRPEQQSPRRSRLPRGGAWDSYATDLRRAVEHKVPATV